MARDPVGGILILLGVGFLGANLKLAYDYVLFTAGRTTDAASK